MRTRNIRKFCRWKCESTTIIDNGCCSPLAAQVDYVPCVCSVTHTCAGRFCQPGKHFQNSIHLPLQLAAAACKLLVQQLENLPTQFKPSQGKPSQQLKRPASIYILSFDKKQVACPGRHVLPQQRNVTMQTEQADKRGMQQQAGAGGK